MEKPFRNKDEPDIFRLRKTPKEFLKESFPDREGNTRRKLRTSKIRKNRNGKFLGKHNRLFFHLHNFKIHLLV